MIYFCLCTKHCFFWVRVSIWWLCANALSQSHLQRIFMWQIIKHSIQFLWSSCKDASLLISLYNPNTLSCLIHKSELLISRRYPNLRVMYKYWVCGSEVQPYWVFYKCFISRWMSWMVQQAKWIHEWLQIFDLLWQGWTSCWKHLLYLFIMW